LSVTVVAPTAALADGLSTAFFVMGPESAREYCRQRPEIAALFVCSPTESGRPEIHAMGFGDGELRMVEEG
jgi:thiamine biosynthesis lipoprotein